MEVAHPVKGGASSAAEPTAGAAEPTAAGGHAADPVDLGKNMLEEIAQLEKKQKEARDAKVAAGRQLRNAERRRKRLKKRASKLRDADLLAVISLRSHEKALNQRDPATDGEAHEDAKSIPDDPGASSSSAATSKATTKPSSKKPRGS